AFYNSCRHRGAPVVRVERGRNRALRCQYHSWTYDTTGKLVSVPDERDFVDLKREDRGLVQIKVETIGGWIFITENLNATSLTENLGDITKKLSEDTNLLIAKRETEHVQNNWKLVQEILSDNFAYTSDELSPAGHSSGKDSYAISPNLLRVTIEKHDVVLSTWPIDENATELEIVYLAPPSETETSPAQDSAWQKEISSIQKTIQQAIE
ncbi:uncharacterized protein METZ01_LOCUS383121, partial [marine metagenome]